jgi:N-glycosidase YbiA
MVASIHKSTTMDKIEFSSKSAQFSEFSNFYPATFEIAGVTYPTVEHYFQCQKFPTDPVLQSRIRNAEKPQQAKRLGKTKSSHFRTDWNEARDEIMWEGLMGKFSQNPELMELLRSTDGKMLVEKSFWDAYWGSGRSGKGLNKMGQFLERIRDSQ